MTTFSAFHQPMPGFLTEQADTLSLVLALRGELPERVLARAEPDNEEFLFAMTPQRQAGSWTFFQVDIPKSAHIERTDYLFKLVWPDRSMWLNALGLFNYMPPMAHAFRFAHDRQLPYWSADQIYYQIFPERFANGAPELSPKTGEYRYLNQREVIARDWQEQPSRDSSAFEFFGGDLIGVRQKLDYLQQTLGITAIYLNPVFESPSSHKYDTQDYFRVDPHFGGNEALQDLITEMHERDMKIVLDAVINHTSYMHPWFQSALQGDEAARELYIFQQDDFVSWKGHRNLPVLDYSNPKVVAQMVTADDSVIRHWLRPPYSIDGWRMDVIHMLGEGPGARHNAHHVRQLRQVVKQENPDAMLLGEHFFEATKWLQGDQEDCAMNYFGFAHPVRAFLAGQDIAFDPVAIDAAQFAHWLATARASISFDHQLLQFNQLDSHDTPRFLSLLNRDEQLMTVAIAFLMTYIGTPCLYYGTEIGLEGEGDPDCRRPFPWSDADWNQNLLATTQHWITLRKQYSCLRRGALIDVYAEGDVMVFARVDAQSQMLVAINRGPATEVTVNGDLPGSSELWSPLHNATQSGTALTDMLLHLPAKGVAVWQRS